MLGIQCTVVTQTTLSHQRSHSLLQVFCARPYLWSSLWTKQPHQSNVDNWVPAHCWVLLPNEQPVLIWSHRVSSDISGYFEGVSEKNFLHSLHSNSKHTSQEVWCLSAIPQASTCQLPTAVELVSTLETHGSSECGKRSEEISKLLDSKEAHGDDPAARF